MTSVGLESLDEFDEPAMLQTTFCQQLTDDEYAAQTTNDTENAIKDLIAYLDSEPALYLRLLQKRRQEEKESAGLFSYLKVKLLSAMNGGAYPGSHVTMEECNDSLSQLKDDMIRAFNYSKESKSVNQRYSKRLEEKRTRQMKARQNDKENMPPRNASVPPPPPMPPLSSSKKSISFRPHNTSPRDTPTLRERDSPMMTPTSNRMPLNRHKRKESCCSSLASLHDDLQSSNPKKRLRKTAMLRSPGGTPVTHRVIHRQISNSGLKTLGLGGTPLHVTLMTVLEQKFRNVRSPSPVEMLYNNAQSPASACIYHDFSP